MSHNRTLIFLTALGLGFLTGLPASASDYQPYGPSGYGIGEPSRFGELQLFAPDQFYEYGGFQQPNEGYWFSADYLHWAIPSPRTALIGHPGEGRETVFSHFTPDADTDVAPTPYQGYAMLDTSDFSSRFTDGQRYEFGRMANRQGIFFSFSRMNNAGQSFSGESVYVEFDDAPAFGPQWADLGPIDPIWSDPVRSHLQGFVGVNAATGLPIMMNLPVVFPQFEAENRVDFWTLELNLSHRLRQFHRGGNLEIFGGVRYSQFDESFNVLGTGDFFGEEDEETLEAELLAERVGPLGESFWNTRANNHLIGPQIGARYFKQWGRWSLSGEGRFFAAFNQQSVRQTGRLGSINRLYDEEGETEEMILNVIYGMGPRRFSHSFHTSEWAPSAEARFEVQWHWTRNVAIKAGWTGIYMDSIARPNDMIEYRITPTETMGIVRENNRQGVFANGLNVGLQINR